MNGNNSTIRPIGGGVLEALLNETPHTLAVLAVAARICEHPPALRALPAELANGRLLHLCGLCGAVTTTQPGEPVEGWIRPTLTSQITREMVLDFQGVCATLRDVDITLGSVTLDARDAAFGTSDEGCRKHASILQSVCAHTSALVRSPTVVQGARLQTAAIYVKDES